MVLGKLGDSLKKGIQKIVDSTFITDEAINELTKDLQRALLSSDVDVKLVFELTKNIKERALKEEIPKNVTKKEHIVNIVYEELVKFLGKETKEIDTTKKPTKILLTGLFGAGKTTIAGKLGKYYSTRGHKVAAIELDVWRPAAYNQLKQLSQKANMDVYGKPEEKDPIKIYKQYEEKLNEYDIVIIDTAGRNSLSEELVEELEKIKTATNPDENFLVLSADIGQAAKDQATTFHKTCKITGVVITKLDGTAKGGGALSACTISGAPITFIGVGEKIEDLEKFNPKGFVGRLIGLGDLETLLEKVNEAITEDEQQDLEKKLMKGNFNLLDLFNQMEAMKKMGPLGKVLEMIPGFGQLKLPKDLVENSEDNLKKWKILMNSMTQYELENPDTITKDRIERITKGSGTSIQDLRDLLKQYKQGKKMMKMMKGGGNNKMQNLMKKFGGGGGLPGM